MTRTCDAFSKALLDSQAPLPNGVVGPDGLAAPKRFSVYRNNVIVSLIEAVKDTYPAIERLLGEEYFRALSHAFVIAHPPQSPVLLSYGGQFSDFVSTFEPLKAYPYLPDVARLEWAWLESYHSRDCQALTAGELSSVEPEALPDLMLSLHPASRLVQSAWPVFSLVAANRFAIDENHAVDMQENQTVLVTRPELDVDLHLLAKGEGVFLEKITGGNSLGNAAEYALQSDGDFELGKCLGHFLSIGVFETLENSTFDTTS